MTGSDVAARALSQLGTPFRLHGRQANVALDCVGLAAHAFDVREFPNDYGLKGDLSDLHFSYLEQVGLRRISLDAKPIGGDLAIVAPSICQLHLMIHASDGWVHGHAGLRRVVHTPGQSPWPILALWRMKGG
ncbi:MAG: hypothetical protein RL481_63 [Pseudomonadota bacterium]|jgi:murein DD-endopeptidase / murein LD-carboxypeptidase